MKATGFFKKSLSLNGHSVVVRFNLAQNYFYLGEISKSNTYINELLNSVKHDIDFKILKAKILTKRKKYFQAYSLFRSIRPEIIISNNESASYFAMTCYKNNKIDEGLDVLSKTSKIIGEFPNLKSNLELIKTKQGES